MKSKIIGTVDGQIQPLLTRYTDSYAHCQEIIDTYCIGLSIAGIPMKRNSVGAVGRTNVYPYKNLRIRILFKS